VQKGVSIYEVSKLLGHADIKTTQIYAHLRSDELRNAVERLGENPLSNNHGGETITLTLTGTTSKLVA